MITPTNGNVLVKVERLEELVSKSGFIIKTKEQGETIVEAGQIIATPKGSSFKIGQKVYYKDYSLSTIKIGDEEYNFLPEGDILGYA